MKRFLFMSLVVALACVGSVSAESATWSRPGTLTGQVGVGLHWGGVGELQGGVDYGLVQLPLAPVFPLDVGVSGRLALVPNGVGAGVYGTLHYSLKALKTGAAWIDGFEPYLGIGLGLLPGLGLDGYGGLAYHFNKSWGIYAEGGVYGSVLGASYRF